MKGVDLSRTETFYRFSGPPSHSEGLSGKRRIVSEGPRGCHPLSLIPFKPHFLSENSVRVGLGFVFLLPSGILELGHSWVPATGRRLHL